MQLKICGITRLEDAMLVTKLGGWAVGFIFVKESPRYIEPSKAAKIITSLPDSIEKVGVFADSSIGEVINTANETGLTMIQLHGNETAEYCAKLKKQVNLPLIKAIRVKKIDDLLNIPDYKDFVSAILLDSYSSNQLGGTGKSFDWNIALTAKDYKIPIILAGGINPDNIREACEAVQPYALDISSGVEADKGIKDHGKLNLLFETVKNF